jgi:hypothetical protein
MKLDALMRECTSDMYTIQEENVAIEGGGPKYNNQRGFNPGNRGNFSRVPGRGNFCIGGRGMIICYKYNQPRHLARNFLNLCTMCTYCREMDHAIKHCPQLLAKW